MDIIELSVSQMVVGQDKRKIGNPFQVIVSLLMETVENQRIFFGYSLIYSLPFLYNIFLPFCTLFISFLCLPDV